MRIFKKSLLLCLDILSVVASIVCSVALLWYTLPAIRTCIIGDFITAHISEGLIFWSSIASGSVLMISLILNLIWTSSTRASVKNFFVHTATWLSAIIILLTVAAVFVLTNPISSTGIEIGPGKKVMIGIDVILLLLFHLFSGKFAKIINRRIQAYETSKEMSVAGRSSIIFVNILKLVEILLPEMLVLVLLCLLVSWDISGFFALLLIGFIIPVVGNIISDFNIRAEILRKDKEKKDGRLVK